MKIRLIIFLVISLTIVFSVHLAIYFSLVKYLKISNLDVKKALAIALSFLSVGFILSSILTRYSTNILVKLSYMISAYWSGMIIYLLLSALLMLILGLCVKTLKLEMDTRTLFSILLILSFVFSVFGLVSSLTPRIKDIKVSIKDLPEQWIGKTLVQVSDLHLGLIYNGWFADKVINQVNELGPEMVFFTGDYLDGSCPHIELLLAHINKVKSDNIFYIFGNHETYIGPDKIRELLAGTKTKVLEDEIVRLDGLNIIGAAYPNQGEEKDHKELFSQINPAEANILLYHEPRLMDIAKKSGVDLQLSGHTHKGQLWPYGFFTWLIYGKYHYGLYSEDGYTIYTSKGTGTWGPPNRFLNRGEIVRITLNS